MKARKIQKQIIFLSVFFISILALSTLSTAQAPYDHVMEFLSNGQIRTVPVNTKLYTDYKGVININGVDYSIRVMGESELKAKNINMSAIPSVYDVPPTQLVFPPPPAPGQTELIAKYLGVEINVAQIILACVVILILVLITAVITKEGIAIILVAIIMTGIFAILSFLPMWIPFIIAILLGVWLLRGGH